MNTNTKRTPTQNLLDFIIDQKLELSQYDLVLTPRIKEKFTVTSKSTGRIATRGMVQVIINWEEGNQKASLEETLNEIYIITAKP